MIYRSFNEGLFNKSNIKKIDESFYKFCKDIITYIFEEEAKIWEKKEGFIPEECDYSSEYKSIEEKILKIKNNNDSICNYSLGCFDYTTLKEEKKIISKISSKFKLKPVNTKSISNLDNYSFIKYQNDGSLISIDIHIRCVVCKDNTLAPHTIFFKIKYYEDKDKAKGKLNLKESTNCGIFNNVDFV